MEKEFEFTERCDECLEEFKQDEAGTLDCVSLETTTGTEVFVCIDCHVRLFGGYRPERGTSHGTV
jgi:hypothetical protein